MDSLTQIVLGASLGEAVLGKKVGNKALLWGGIAGTIPDLDVLSDFFLSDFQSLLFHRGITHSFLFGLLLSPILAYLVHKLYKNESASYKEWLGLFLLAILTHPLLDAFTNYGTQLFYPFSDYRVSWNTIFVIDPLYTLPLLIGCILLLIYKKNKQKRKRINTIALILSSGYLALTVVTKIHVEQQIVDKLQKQKIVYKELMTSPAPFTTMLWSVIVQQDKRFLAGYYSLFDGESTLQLMEIPQEKYLLDGLLHHEDIQKLIRFSKGYYSLQKTNNGLILNDLRFSTISGWFNVSDEYVFSFWIEKEDGKVTISRKEPEGRFKLESFKNLGKRIIGRNPKINGQ